MNSIPAPDQPLDPRAALASITAAETSTRKSIGPNVAVLYFVWAAAYLLGYGLLQGSTAGWLPLPFASALLIGAVILLAAIVFSAWAGIRSGRQIRGDSRFAGMAYGMSWMAGFTTLAVFSIALFTLLPDAEPETTGWLINAVAIMIVAIMYMAGAAIFHDKPMFVLGACFAVVNIAGLLAGPTLFMAIFALAGPVLLGAAGILALIMARLPAIPEAE
ncbi:hypothetical protein [Paeniglutamicibacter cryotolerans]|uniref:Uncharacterized protein n=1 Tax=Paeniglutamicibacter cryotolerans TaxID=670079 RepID=A0A839QU17_9MICC|nr:hypothetical protein [Paeniglutamicibacter cryotolerans]MBB2996772.1 hypothetical protein [Paeniglutamicibacter cryotolerans]